MTKSTIKTFFNWTTDDFTYPYAGEDQYFPAGESRMMESGMADHFAKHLADWQMDKQGIKAIERNKHKEFMDKCFIAETAPMTAQKVEATILNQEVPEEAPVEEEKSSDEQEKPIVPVAKKRGRPAKVEAPQFEGIE